MNHNKLLEVAAFTPKSLQYPGSWLGHLPFAAWVIQEIGPSMFVELGTHSGNSYFAFCQAVREAGLATKCFAVDTWHGDEHAGRYSDEIFAQVNEHNQSHYADFSLLLRMTFDDAAAYFSQQSIELLHIDGLHTYDAVRHDFDTWLPKLAPGAIVIFHDTNVREREFGVWKLWEELKSQYSCHLEFNHSHGLGVLQLNNVPDGKKIEWMQPDSSEKHRLLQYFAALGSRQIERFDFTDSLNRAVAKSDGQINNLNQVVAERDEQVDSLKQAVAERDGQVDSLKQAVIARDQQIAIFQHNQHEQERKINQLLHTISHNSLMKFGCLLDRMSFRRWYEYHGFKRLIKAGPLFDAQWYLSQYPYMSISQSSPLEHYFYFGAEEGKNPNPYFDTQWYFTEYPDVFRSKMNPLLHYIKRGVKEGRNPSPYFDTRWYLSEYPDVVRSGMNPLLHYIRHGVEEGTNPSPYFDTCWYLSEYPNVADSGINPLLHYIRHGAAEGTNPSPYFDTRWYLSEYPDVARSGINPLLHYIRQGAEEGKNPSPYFDTRWYLTEYSGIANSGINPLLHYIRYGAEERKNPSPFFDTRWYLDEYPAVALSGMNPLLHYLRYGVAEETSPNPFFDTRWYLAEYPDVADSGMNPLRHYLNFGVKEGRNPNPYFDTRWYLAEYPDVAHSGMNPLLHYMRHGIEEGTNPILYFDTRWYLTEYPDVAHHCIHPLAHYLKKGIEEERSPNPHFDTRWYLDQYPNSVKSGEDPLVHYIKHGVIEGTNPSPFFETNWYLKEYPDVARSGINPLLHYLQHGIKEGKKPNPYFDARGYLNTYCKWIWQYDTLSEDDRHTIKQHIQDWQNPPRLSVLMPVYNPPPQYLDEAIRSVRKQLYPYWELCIADDASTDPEVKRVLERHSAADERIKVMYRPENGHISRASNSALELVTGEYVALLDHDDVLSEHALFWVAEAIQRQPDAGLIYSDEDKMDPEGNRIDPYFKCDWNPFLFLGHNMISHLGVYRTALVRELGGFRVGFEGSQDYDLAARVIGKLKIDQIIHIPRILYHWRVIPGSTASDPSEKPYALIASEKVVNEYMVRQNLPGKATGVPSLGGMHRVKFTLPEHPPLVSILIPTRNGEKLVQQCVESITSRTTYSNYEILLIDNGSDSSVALQYFAQLAKTPRIRVLRDDEPFNFSRLNNRAAEDAKGDILVLLNNDTEVVTPEWLDEMVSLALLPNIGAVGARLCYPDGTLQHGGVILGLGGCAAHAHSCIPRESAGYFGRAKLLHMVTAVTGACLAIKKSIFKEVGGLDEEKLKIGYNDVDFCLKLRAKGYWNVWTPQAELIHYESVSRGYEDTPEKNARFLNEISFLKKKWPNSFFRDPAYNPNLTLALADFSLSKRPRLVAGLMHHRNFLSKGFLAPRTTKPRLLIATLDRQAETMNRFCEIADSLCRQGILESYIVADRHGFVSPPSLSQGWFDTICLLGDSSGIRWFQQSVMGCLPYLAVWHDTSWHDACASGKSMEDIKQSLVHSAAVSLESWQLLRQLKKITSLDLEYCTSIIPDGMLFPQIFSKLEKPKGMIWQYDDAVFLNSSRSAIIRAVNEFSINHKLPVYLIGKFPEEICESLQMHIRKDINDVSEYHDFLKSSGALIGLAPLEEHDPPGEAVKSLIWGSDIRMVEYGGLGIPGVYSAVPPYLDNDLRTGRVVENTFEAWRDALEGLYANGYLAEQENSLRIRDQRSVEHLARDCWWPAIEKVMLDEPLSAAVISR